MKYLITITAAPVLEAAKIRDPQLSQPPRELMTFRSEELGISVTAHEDDVEDFERDLYEDDKIVGWAGAATPKDVLERFVKFLREQELLIEPKFKFHTYQVAEISMRHVPQEDRDLMTQSDSIPLIAGYERGGFFYVPDSETVTDLQIDLIDAGWSNAFVDLVLELRHQGIKYFRFDAEGYEVEGAPQFE